MFRSLSPVLHVASCAALTAGLCVAHWDGLTAMVGLWSRSPMYSYAYTVPFISAYLVWSRREALRTLRPHGSWMQATPVLLVGILMLAAGQAGSFQVLQQLALPVNVVGVLLALLGVGYVRTAWAGLAYLLLMIPVWDGLTEPLHQPFQNQSATLGITMIRWLGIPAFREQTVIVLPNLTIEVARACSGVNYLVAVIALGLPLAYVHLRTLWRRVALIASAVMIAALSNGLRVALIGTLAYLEIGSPLHGPFHVLHGLFVSGIGYVALFAGLRWLSEGEAESSNRLRTDAPLVRPFAGRRLVTTATILATVFWTIAAAPSIRASRNVSLGTELASLPLQLDRWMGQPLPLTPGGPAQWASADYQLRRQYSRDAGPAIEVYVGYFESQRQNRELAGWTTADLHRRATLRSLSLADGTALPVNAVRLPGERPQYALFWYELDGAIETRRYAAVLRTAWNGFVRQRSNGAVVMISAEDSSSGAPAEVVAALEEVAALVHVALGHTLPGRSK